MSDIALEDQIHLGRATRTEVRRRSRRLLGSLLRPMRWRFAATLALVALAQFAKAAGPVIVASAIDNALPLLIDGDATRMLVDAVLYLGSAVGGGLLTMAYLRLNGRISQDVLFDMRGRVFRHTQGLSLEFHEQYTSGRIIARQTSDLDAVRELLDSGISSLLSGFLYMLSIATLLVILDPQSGAMLLVAVIPVALLTWWFQNRSQLHYRSTRVASANLIVQFIETMSGHRAVQAFRAEKRNSGEHARLSEEYRVADRKAVGLIGVYDPGIVLIGNLTVAAVLAYDGFRVFDGTLELGALVAATLYAKRFFQPVQDMARFYNSLQSALAALEKISGFLGVIPSIRSPRHPAALGRVAGEIRFDDVRFAYGAGADVIPRLDLTIDAGQTVALVARFYDVTEGSVRIDGTDVREISNADLRRAVVMVTQESFLFSGTVADNISIGRPEATRDEVIAAARAVGAHRFVEELPEGYDTDVNTRGGRLSAGQRQLVSFARAFLADPAVLILDEATSSLDLPSETMVQRALDTLLDGRTAIIIAHRLSTVEHADRVLVLEHGSIIEDGSPAALIAQERGVFAAMHAAWKAVV
jgi:ATP-binding cassette subfamily B protein